MRYSGACRRIRGGSHTGLIGKKTSFDTIHDTGTCKSSEDGTDVKGIRENVGEHFRNQGIVGHCHKKSYSQIEDSHKRNQHLCDLGNLFASPKDAQSKDQSQDHTYKQRGGGFIKKAVSPEGVCNIERSYQVEAAHIGQDQEQCK